MCCMHTSYHVTVSQHKEAGLVILGHLTKERFSTCHGVAVAMTMSTYSLLATQHGEMRLLGVGTTPSSVSELLGE
jgi:hypothetical protein